eukprot:gene19162-10601_t
MPAATSTSSSAASVKSVLETELDALHQKANEEIDVKRLNVLRRALSGEMTVATCARLLKAYVDRGKQNLKKSFRYGRRGGGTAMDEARKELVEKVASKLITIEAGLVELKALDQAQLALHCTAPYDQASASAILPSPPLILDAACSITLLFWI